MEVGQIVIAKVIKIMPTYLLAKVANKFDGILHIGNISDFYISKIENTFQLGHDYIFRVINVNNENKRLELSWKEISPRFQKDPFEYIINETNLGFENLEMKVKEDIEND